MLRVSISVKDEDAGRELLEALMFEFTKLGTGVAHIEGDGGPDIKLEIVNEDNSEFVNPVGYVDEDDDE